MKKFSLVSAVAVLSASALLALGSIGVASGSDSTTHNVVTVYNGPAIPNTHAMPPTAAFASWCGSVCAPSVALPVFDASNGRATGHIYVWTKNLDLSPGADIAFGEFIWFDLNDGNVYVNSGEHGTFGGVISKAPTHLGTDPGAVVAGGGDGTIVGGTGKYSKWTGTYTDRVFVELDFAGGANYYDQLFFSINPN